MNTEYWADVVAIEQVLYRYAHVLDRGTAAEAIQLFTHDAKLTVDNAGAETHYVGADAVRDWMQTYHYDQAGRIRNMRHKIATPLIQVDGDSATSVCYLDADGVDTANERGRVTVGRYEDVLVRSGERWLIQDRTLIITDRHRFAES